MVSEVLASASNHLWQSTVFAGAAGLLTLALRKNPARIRHRIWVVASLKFLVPFSLLIGLGAHVPWHKAPGPVPVGFPVVIDQVSQPFTASPDSFSASDVTSHSGVPPIVLLSVWACGFLCVAISSWRRWRRVVAAVRTGSLMEAGVSILTISSPSFLEPGIFGVFRPVLLLPEGILEHLTPDQWSSVVAHELCHVRHRDNLVGAVQMFVEALFWFHPMVWWIGKRICHERERGCDEEVLQLGSEPRTYAQGILKVCELCLESPVACVAGVSGSNLRKRIEGIMHHRAIRNIGWSRKALIASAAAMALVIPVIVGIAHAPSVRAQDPGTPKFEVASIRVNNSDSTSSDVGPPVGDHFSAVNVYVQRLIRIAYGLQDFQISGAPGWLETEHYDITAKADRRNISTEQYHRMLQDLLADRFLLRVHREMKESTVMSLTTAAGGAKIHAKDCPISSPSAADLCRTSMRADTGEGTLSGHFVAIADLASSLERITGRIVTDKTGLAGKYDIDLKWVPDVRLEDLSGPSLSSALQEQLGLRLESTKGQVEVLVIDHVERPSEN